VVATAVISSGQFIALAIPALVGMCVLLSGFLLLADRKTELAAPAKIEGIAPGQVAVRGFATGPYTITAPITGEACYLYRTAIWQQEKSEVEGWEKLVDETLHVPFFLDDSTGQLLIEPLGANSDISTSLREEYAAAAFYGASTIPPALYVFLERHRITPTNRIMVEESYIGPHSDLFVCGTVTENPGIEIRPPSSKRNGIKPDGPMLDAPAPEIVRLSTINGATASDAISQQSRIAAALMKAGIQNPNAWAAAGVPYPGAAKATAVLHEDAEPMPEKTCETTREFDPKPPLVMMKSTDKTPFVLSSHRIELPVRGSRWKGLLLVSVGGTLTLASFWIFLTKFLR
jgi:hypothetical protein